MSESVFNDDKGEKPIGIARSIGKRFIPLK
jgi:hypothetical protein